MPLITANDRIGRKTLVASFIVLYAIYLLTYLAIDAFTVGRVTHQLFMPFERDIPFVPEAEVVYGMAYLVPLVAIQTLSEASRVVRLLVALLVAIAAAYTVFLVFPVEFPRPAVHAHSLATLLLSLQYTADKPYNAFPSLHVAITWLVWLGCRDRVRHGGPFLILLIAISASTVLVKQHYLADVVAGGALAASAWQVAGLLVRSRLLNSARRP